MLTNTQYEDVKAYILSGKTDLERGYRTCNMEKLYNWYKCKKMAMYFDGELRIIRHNTRSFTAGILYTYDDGKNWSFVTIKNGEIVDKFYIGTVKTLARMKKTARKGWWHNPANTDMVRIAY